jgi:hypothetical protein
VGTTRGVMLGATYACHAPLAGPLSSPFTLLTLLTFLGYVGPSAAMPFT